ncbi:MAG: glycosyltransferase [Bacteroidota bacterium]
MTKIKVLHIIKSLGRGGAEMLLPETLLLHDKDKFEFHYIYFLPWKDQLVEHIKTHGGKVTCFNANNNLQLMTRRNKVVSYIREHDINLIHAHLPWAGFLARYAVNKGNRILFYTEHNKQERYHWLTALLNRYTFNRQSLAIAVSADVQKSIQKNISPSVLVRLLLNGVNTIKFSRDVKSGQRIRQENDIPLDAIVVGTISVFRSQKRLKEWVNVFYTALESNPNLFGIIVGDGLLKNEVIDEISKLKLQQKILLPGLQVNTVEWLSSMDIFMMTSRFEGLPIALLEAMSCKCAVVSTDAGGIKEVIPDRECGGLLRGVDDFRLLSQDLLTLTSDQPQLKEMGKKARKRVVAKFSLNRMVARLEDLYSEYTRF